MLTQIFVFNSFLLFSCISFVGIALEGWIMSTDLCASMCEFYKVIRTVTLSRQGSVMTLRIFMSKWGL